MNKRPPRRISVADVVACVRKNGPMTKMQIAEALAFGPITIAEKVLQAKRDGLLARVGSGERREYLHGAVQQRDWPQQEQQQ